MRFRNNTYISTLAFSILSISIVGCTKMIAIDPPVTSINQANVFQNDETAISALIGIYTAMSASGPFTGNSSISVMTALSSDELRLISDETSAMHLAYYSNNLIGNTNPSLGGEFWSALYNYIFYANSAIEGLEAATALTPAIKNQLIGEAKFLRAFYYLYLVQLYGPIPIVVSTDYKSNGVLTRASVGDVYQQIINDLKEAEILLSSEYLSGNLKGKTGQRLRPTKWAAIALLARAYLNIGEWKDAVEQATTLIQHSELYKLEDLENAFLKDTKEAIWQLQPVVDGYNTEDAVALIIPVSGFSTINGPTGNPFYLDPSLIKEFEDVDQRKAKWISVYVDSSSIPTKPYYYSHKYKSANYGDPVSEYLTVFRLAEQFLIRSEARIELNDLSGANDDINVIRIRAGLSPKSISDKASLVGEVQRERRLEFFTEWGHRWFDLKRWKSIDSVMTDAASSKGASWSNTDQLYPIPFDDLIRASQLYQNSGY